ncbi:unnamed protein product [Phytomonas sp. EM1]|nr:unnamed protein product [Phytomonas sp. EM1]|eukprot:CCW65593.1 unnamed protein product [Phytomonas sp. isolate EM1]
MILFFIAVIEGIGIFLCVPTLAALFFTQRAIFVEKSFLFYISMEIGTNTFNKISISSKELDESLNICYCSIIYDLSIFSRIVLNGCGSPKIIRNKNYHQYAHEIISLNEV